MTSKVLQIDLRDAGRDGIYRVVPDDPMTLVDDAARAGLRLIRIDLRDCASHPRAMACLAQAFEFGVPSNDWPTLAAGLRDLGWLSAPGYVLVPARGVPFFVFMVFPDNEKRDAAIDA